MLRTRFTEAFRVHLIEQGCPLARVDREVEEMRDHFEDLKSAAAERGLGEGDAEAEARARLGEPAVLAETVVRVLRESSWWGRHRILSFCVLPPLMVIAMVAACLFGAYLCGKYLVPDELALRLADGTYGIRYLAVAAGCIFPLSVVVSTVLFCWIAIRSAAGVPWTMASAAICAFFGYFGFVQIKPHVVVVGMVSRPSWMNLVFAAAPIAIAGGIAIRHWWRRRRWGASLLSGASSLGQNTLLLSLASMALFVSGCASGKAEKTLHSRGWIGGEFEVVRQETWYRQAFRSEGKTCDPHYDAAVGGKQSAAIRISTLGTNTPAALAGLREGDWILELNTQPVTRLKDFNRIVDRCAPGSPLAIKALREGQPVEHVVPVGQEKFRYGGTVSLCLPSFVEGWDLWPNPGFSFVFVGFHANPGKRHEFGKRSEVSEENWRSWLVIIGVSSQKRIKSQAAFAPIAAAPAQSELSLMAKSAQSGEPARARLASVADAPPSPQVQQPAADARHSEHGADRQ